jgi:hypothetical protein
LKLSLDAKAQLLVTGGAREFGHLYGSTLHGTRVVTPASALDAVLKDAGV